MNTVIKPLASEHFEQSMELSSFAFQYSLTPEQLEERRKTFLRDGQMVLGVMKGNELCAQATLLDLHVYIAGKPFSMGGIAGVSTWPEHRRHGYVAKLLSELLVRMKEKQQAISMLHPFSFAFYRKFGWESFIEYKSYEIGSEQLSAILRGQQRNEQAGTVYRIADWQPLQHIYDQYAKQYNGMLQRSENWWKDRVAKQNAVYSVYEDEQGQLQGYLIYEAVSRQMNIHEFVALSYEAEQGLLRFIAQHDSMVEQVKWKAPVNDQFIFGLDNPRIKHDITPYFMARIVDVAAFIAQYSFTPAPAHETEQYRIKVVDEHAVWNNGIFELCIASDGSATIKQEDQFAQANITISVGALTAWLLNYQTWDTLVRFGKAEGDQLTMKRLQNRINAQTTYLTDFF